jgi:hypothetical protein
MKADDPRTVFVEVEDAFFRSTFFRSGDRGGGRGRGVMMDDRDDLVGEDDCSDVRDREEDNGSGLTAEAVWRDERDWDDANGSGLGGIRSVS